MSLVGGGRSDGPLRLVADLANQRSEVHVTGFDSAAAQAIDGARATTWSLPSPAWVGPGRRWSPWRWGKPRAPPVRVSAVPADVVFLFQLWWMLALRFCIPPAISFQVLAQFLADGKDLPDDINAAFEADFDAFVQMPGAADLLVAAPLFEKPSATSRARSATWSPPSTRRTRPSHRSHCRC